MKRYSFCLLLLSTLNIFAQRKHINFDEGWLSQFGDAREPGKLEAFAYKKENHLTKKVDTTGAPYEVVLTPYKTTIYANGKDVTVMNITVVDRQGRQVPDANNLITFRWTGDAKIIAVGNGDPSSQEPNTHLEDSAWQRRLFNGKAQLTLQAGKTESIIKFEARSEGLFPASTGIHSISTSQTITKTTSPARKKKPVDKMLGADISFLPQLEARGMKFRDKDVEADPIQILKNHGFNYIRLRIFNDPARDSGYSPKQGFCDLTHTLAMAKRVKAEGMKLLLDFHYSDYWADPEKQYKPAAWRGQNFDQLKKSFYEYTKSVIQALKAQGTSPDMVQIGNEINHGIVWPEGHVSNLDSLAQLIKAGTDATLEVDPSIIMMLHIALGGQADESIFFIGEMLKRNVHFDVIGQSYYPKWHGTLSDLENNLTNLANKYGNVILVEYSQLKKEVAEIAFNLPNGRGKGTCIWEPLSTWERIFDRDGKSNALILIYDELHKKFMQ
jgi:beta-galactosidase